MKNKCLLFIAVISIAVVSCKKDDHDYDASGSFEAVETIISAEVNGKILEFNIQEGQQLNAGQRVGYIDSTQLYLQKLQIEQSRKAILSGRPHTQLQLEALRKELENARDDRDRTEKLVKGGVASQSQLDDAITKVATLEARVAAQESALQTTTANLNEQGGTVEAQLSEIKDQLSKSVIINPVKGTVLSKYSEQYEMVSAGRPLYKIADLSTIILRAYITGDQLPKVKIGQKVMVYTDDGNGGFKKTEGVITWINDKAEFTPKNIQTKNERANLVYAMKISLRNDGYFKIGMYGEIKF